MLEDCSLVSVKEASPGRVMFHLRALSVVVQVISACSPTPHTNSVPDGERTNSPAEREREKPERGGGGGCERERRGEREREKEREREYESVCEREREREREREGGGGGVSI